LRSSIRRVHWSEDILAADFTTLSAVDALKRYAISHPDAELAVVLLNQRVLAGLGNVYKSEVAFAAGVNPFRKMHTITTSEMEKIATIAQRYMQTNVVNGAGDGIVTYSGNRRTTRAMNQADRVWVYRRRGQECRRCGTIINMRKQGEQARSTYWCPSCQPYCG
jgi:endonuclease-8